MSELLTTTLPDADEMMRRLTTVDNDFYMQERFYPLVVRETAGRELTGAGFVVGMTFAVSAYTKGLPSIVTHAMLMLLAAYVRAVLDDPAVQAEALESVRQMGLPV